MAVIVSAVFFVCFPQPVPQGYPEEYELIRKKYDGDDQRDDEVEGGMGGLKMEGEKVKDGDSPLGLPSGLTCVC